VSAARTGGLGPWPTVMVDGLLDLTADMMDCVGHTGKGSFVGASSRDWSADQRARVPAGRHRRLAVIAGWPSSLCSSTHVDDGVWRGRVQNLFALAAFADEDVLRTAITHRPQLLRVTKNVCA
jgi:hypothetical protein